jgi:GNAT superfamily N-acetyltransferase
MDIRIADVRDAAAIAAVLVASWRTTYPGIVAQAHIDGLSVQAQTDRWTRRFGDQSAARPDVLVAELATSPREIVGFASGGPIREPHPGFDAELHAIYLLRDAQGRGVGRRLVRQWATLALARGFTSAVVRVLAANPSRRFYERLGARPLKEAALAIGGESYPEIWYGWDDLHVLTS